MFVNLGPAQSNVEESIMIALKLTHMLLLAKVLTVLGTVNSCKIYQTKWGVSIRLKSVGLFKIIYFSRRMPLLKSQLRPK